MFVLGIAISSVTLVAYILWFFWMWFHWKSTFDFEEYTYDFTVLADACVVLCCLLVDTTRGGIRIIDITLAGVTLSSVVLRFIETDCDGCENDIDTGNCRHNGCEEGSFRNDTKVFINMIPVATAVFRVYKASRSKGTPKPLPTTTQNNPNTSIFPNVPTKTPTKTTTKALQDPPYHYLM